MTAPRRRRSERGIILLEVLVGLTIFAAGIVAVLGAVRTSQRAVTRAEKLLEASWLLDEVLAEWTLNPEEETAGERGAFEWRVEVEPWEAPGSTADTTDAPEMDRVRVEVAWNERGRPVSVEAVELVRRDASKETP